MSLKDMRVFCFVFCSNKKFQNHDGRLKYRLHRDNLWTFFVFKNWSMQEYFGTSLYAYFAVHIYAATNFKGESI